MSNFSQASSSCPGLLTPQSSDNGGQVDLPILPPVQVRYVGKAAPFLSDGNWMRVSADQGITIDVCLALAKDDPAVESSCAGGIPKIAYDLKMNWYFTTSPMEQHPVLPVHPDNGEQADATKDAIGLEAVYESKSELFEQFLNAMKALDLKLEQKREYRKIKEQEHRILIANLGKENEELTARVSSYDTTIAELQSQIKRQNEELKMRETFHTTSTSQLEKQIKLQANTVQRLESALDRAKNQSKAAMKVSDPETLEGQQIGAILKIKKQTESTCRLGFAVGDHIEIVGKRPYVYVDVKNIRSGQNRECIEWESFFPVKPGGKCHCIESDKEDNCRCVYEYLNNNGVLDGNALNPRSLELSDPATPEGQIPGVLLVVKRCFSSGEGVLGVGDCVKILSHDTPNSWCKVKILKDGREVTRVPWIYFF